MVSLDRKQRSAVFSFWRRVFLCLSIFGIVYLGAIRPLRTLVSTQVLNPFFLYILDSKTTVVQINDRTILIERNGSNKNISVSVPFGGYFILPCALFFTAQRKKYIKTLVYYHCILFLLMPGLGIIYAYNFNWPLYLASIVAYLDNIFFVIIK